MTDRNLRYVELDAAGNPFHENWKSWPDTFRGQPTPTEDEVWADLVDATSAKGHTLVRIAADNPRFDRNPRLDEIEGDGKGGIRAKANRPAALVGVRIVKEPGRAQPQ